MEYDGDEYRSDHSGEDDLEDGMEVVSGDEHDDENTDSEDEDEEMHAIDEEDEGSNDGETVSSHADNDDNLGDGIWQVGGLQSTILTLTIHRSWTHQETVTGIFWILMMRTRMTKRKESNVSNPQ